MVLVTATNADGSTGPVNSKPTDVVSPAAAPDNIRPPAITGTAFVGDLLLADPGRYTAGIPDRFSYQWEQCDASGGKCVAIGGEMNQTYTIRRGDVGFTLRVVVKATNDYGSDVTTSDHSPVVTEKPQKVVVTTSMVASTSAVTSLRAWGVSLMTATSSAACAGKDMETSLR